MAGQGEIINDHLFTETVSCPLKFSFITKGGLSIGQRPVYRQRNKLHLRDALAVRFDGVRHTSDETEQAISETKRWLQHENTAICGAVITSGNLLTRIPVLVKKGDMLFIIQVHGKLRKHAEAETISYPVANRTIAGYLLKAAWRLYVVKEVFPDMRVDVKFYFPNKNFRSDVECLHRFAEGDINAEGFKQNLAKLFRAVDATNATKATNESMPELATHAAFSGLSVSEAVGLIQSGGFNEIMKETDIHRGCKNCVFRKGNSDEKGCWNLHFNPGDIRHPNHHIFELIGHGNDRDSGNRAYYQEQLSVREGFNSFEKIRNMGSSVITVQQRRFLQILKMKGEKIPSVWIKPSLNILKNLSRPIHFIDFEAATYALPMKKGSGCYEPTYFQFSCHSLQEDGTLTYNEWLDENINRCNPHLEFADRLAAIPGIKHGTIVQYSPFEKQAVNNLIKEFEKYREVHQLRLEKLLTIRDSGNNQKKDRFFDLSKIIRIGYYNRFMEEGLSLKQVLSSILKWEKAYGEKQNIFDENDSNEIIINISAENPYELIQQKDSSITDGSSAMNAWLALKNGLLDDGEKERIPMILKKYCALDSFALYIIYKHLIKVTEFSEHEDTILY